MPTRSKTPPATGLKRSAPPLPKLAKPAQRALAAAGITSLTDLAKLSKAELAELHGIGPNALDALESALRDAGLRMRK